MADKHKFPTDPPAENLEGDGDENTVTHVEESLLMGVGTPQIPGSPRRTTVSYRTGFTTDHSLTDALGSDLDNREYVATRRRRGLDGSADRAYCIETIGWEYDAQVPLTPGPITWNEQTVFDNVHAQFPDLQEVVVPDAGQAFLFFGRRNLNEGLSLEGATDIATALDYGPRRWGDHHYEFTSTPVTVQYGRRRVAQMWSALRSEQNSKHRKKTSEGHGRRSRTPDSTELDSDSDDYLTGTEPHQTTRQRLTSGSAPPRTRSSGQLPKPRAPDIPKGTRRRGRPKKVPSPKLVPISPPAESDGEGQTSDQSHASSGRNHGRDRRGGRRDRNRHHRRPASRERHGYGGKIELPRLERMGQAYVSEYMVWKKIVTTHLGGGCREAPLLTAILASIMHLPGGLSFTTEGSVEGILSKLDRGFKVTTDQDQLFRELYGLKQSRDEAVESFAGRVDDKVHLIRLTHPERLPEEDMEEVKKDRFFGGLRRSLRDRLSFVFGGATNQYHTYSYDRLMELARSNELEESEHNSTDRTSAKPKDNYSRDNYPGQHKPKTFPRVRKAQATEASEMVRPEGDPDPEEEEEEEEENPATDEVRLAVRLTKMVDEYEEKQRLCYACGSPDHLVRDCPQRRQAYQHLNALGGSGAKGAGNSRDQKKAKTGPSEKKETPKRT